MLGKSIVGLRNLPRPPSAVIHGLLDFLTNFGDGKALLKQMLEVQEHNERVFSEASKALFELRKVQQEIDESRKTNEARFSEEKAAVKNLSAEMARDKTDASAKFAEMTAALDSREQIIQRRELECSGKERALKKTASELREAHAELLKAQNGLEAAIAALAGQRQELDARENKLRAALL